MNWVDLILVGLIVICIWSGYSRGFIIASIDLAKWFGSLSLAFLFYPYLAGLLERWTPSLNVWKLPLAFMLTFIVAFTLISVVLNALLRNTTATMHRSTVNKFFGVIPGFISGLISASTAALLLLSLALSDNVTTTVRNSRLTSQLAPPAEWMEEKLKPVFNDAIHHGLANLTVKPDSGESVGLPYNNVQGKPRADLEAQMLEMVNKERAKQGLKLLLPDTELAPVARAHSTDMFTRGYFSHNNPDGQDPFDRMKRAGIRFMVAGENLALAPTLEMAHTGLMNSPGHRANILNPAFGRLGIGIIDGGKYGLMVSQEFRN